jgi:hypothetical protein
MRLENRLDELQQKIGALTKEKEELLASGRPVDEVASQLESLGKRMSATIKAIEHVSKAIKQEDPMETTELKQDPPATPAPAAVPAAEKSGGWLNILINVLAVVGAAAVSIKAYDLYKNK